MPDFRLIHRIVKLFTDSVDIAAYLPLLERAVLGASPAVPQARTFNLGLSLRKDARAIGEGP
jgi:hypothetical protein